MNFAIAV